MADATVLFYDDNKRLVATSYDQLLIYFKSLPGVSFVQNVDFTLQCPMSAIIKVQSNAALPKFLYMNGTQATNRIYPRQLVNFGADLNSLCTAQLQTNYLQAPQFSTGQAIEVIVQAPQFGTGQVVDANIHILDIQNVGGWILNETYSSAINIEGEVTLDISTVKTGAGGVFIAEPIANVSFYGRPVQDIVLNGTEYPQLLEDSVVTIKANGNIEYTGQATSGGDTIEFFGLKYNING